MGCYSSSPLPTVHALRFFNSTDQIFTVDVEIEYLRVSDSESQKNVSASIAAQGQVPGGALSGSLQYSKHETLKENLFKFIVEPFCGKVVRHKFSAEELSRCRISIYYHYLKLPVLLERVPFSADTVFVLGITSVKEMAGTSVLFEHNGHETNLLTPENHQYLYHNILRGLVKVQFPLQAAVRYLLDKPESNDEEIRAAMNALVNELSPDMKRIIHRMNCTDEIILYDGRLYIRIKGNADEASRNAAVNTDHPPHPSPPVVIHSIRDFPIGYWIQSISYEEEFVNFTALCENVRSCNVFVPTPDGPQNIQLSIYLEEPFWHHSYILKILAKVSYIYYVDPSLAPGAQNAQHPKN